MRTTSLWLLLSVAVAAAVVRPVHPAGRSRQARGGCVGPGRRLRAELPRCVPVPGDRDRRARNAPEHARRSQPARAEEVAGARRRTAGVAEEDRRQVHRRHAGGAHLQVPAAPAGVVDRLSRVPDGIVECEPHLHRLAGRPAAGGRHAEHGSAGGSAERRGALVPGAAVPGRRDREHEGRPAAGLHGAEEQRAVRHRADGRHARRADRRFALRPDGQSRHAGVVPEGARRSGADDDPAGDHPLSRLSEDDVSAGRARSDRRQRQSQRPCLLQRRGQLPRDRVDDAAGDSRPRQGADGEDHGRDEGDRPPQLQRSTTRPRC